MTIGGVECTLSLPLHSSSTSITHSLIDPNCIEAFDLALLLDLSCVFECIGYDPVFDNSFIVSRYVTTLCHCFAPARSIQVHNSLRK
jgi:hypothetical protein